MASPVIIPTYDPNLAANPAPTLPTYPPVLPSLPGLPVTPAGAPSVSYSPGASPQQVLNGLGVGSPPTPTPSSLSLLQHALGLFAPQPTASGAMTPWLDQTAFFGLSNQTVLIAGGAALLLLALLGRAKSKR